MSSRTLEAVGRAAKVARSASLEYRAAVVRARDAGHTLEAIGEAAGTSKQAVRGILGRHKQRGGA